MTSKENASGVEQLLSEDHDELGLLLSGVFDALDMRNRKEILLRLDLFWARLAMHIRAENLHLFPVLLGTLDKARDSNETDNEATTLRQALSQLRDDHNFFMHQLAEAVRLMRDLLATDGNTTADRLVELHRIIDGVRIRLEAHNQLEEEFVYGLPANILSEHEQSTLAVNIRHELGNLPPRFARDCRPSS